MALEPEQKWAKKKKGEGGGRKKNTEARARSQELGR